MLQKEGITLVRVREIFDSVLDDYPELGGHLAPDASIVGNPLFERAVLQLSKGQRLTPEERNSVSCLVLPLPTNVDNNNHDAAGGGDAHDINPQDLSYAQQLELRMKRRKTTHAEMSIMQYLNLDMLSGTSVSCERLFSLAKFILTDTRKSTSPAVFEAILLLKVNRSEWNVQSVGKAMGRTTGAQFSADVGVAVVDDTNLCDHDDDLDLFYDSP